ncbi:hypothetical protein Kpol_1003p17 [Vanderwaltozyma polyspora DSM 70294]|uniref:Vacuolar membrane protein Kpol_1003p17 n=1 Tax=Vanderwaltozyma polyspora (strain ATCC 22028 / DSM 70294 / BCRC 21397 / CBS 2163 / NBRC 10782 / NRRL Y-8283 / UCD 57-17) TaxID=436907 RepID=YNF8_VANPO|nr:uncharacterized protein Kpol_1003p17 [Vanderwaltozyma polyspora DSM 70294]A7TLX5.1 RecName: Full=Vacuolar membrane protein Kpol_1003p17 [Vanderwaltozyma polyspora DSM 70294]EDO16712.1 hypothetical protein Kpol_1003p17 [Vanderwaltozyma polyspora DSM 70294]
MNGSLNIRGLPKLTTSTSISVSSTSASSTLSTTTLSSNSIISSITTDTSGTSTSSRDVSSGQSTLNSISTTSSIIVPSITPPSAAKNPNVWHSEDSDGTVFIAVGSIIGGIFGGVLIWWMITSYLSHVKTKKAYHSDMEEQYMSHLNGGSPHKVGSYHDDKSKIENPFSSFYMDDLESSNKKKYSRVSLVSDNPFDEDLDYALDTTEQVRYNPIQDETNHYANKKDTLFISPTKEVLQQQRQRRESKLFDNPSELPSTPPSNFKTLMLKPERSASPERKSRSPIRQHRKNNSSVQLTPLKLDSGEDDFKKTPTKKKNVNNSNNNNKHKKTPSMYLDDMLENDN